MGCLFSKEDKYKEEASVTSMSEPVAKTVDPRLPWESYRQMFNMKNAWKVVTRSFEATAKDNLSRFFAKHPEHKALHKDLVKYDTDEKLHDSTAFENAALSIFNTFDHAMESMESNPDDCIKGLLRAGKMHSKIKNFDTAYFTDMEESFIESVKETMGERFTEASQKNFTILYEFVVAQLIEGLNSVARKTDDVAVEIKQPE